MKSLHSCGSNDLSASSVTPRGSYTRLVPDDDSCFPDLAAVAEVELPDPNPAARRRSVVKMSLARAVQTWDHGHERERGREKISIGGPPKSGETFIDYWCIYLGQIPPYI